MAANRDWAKRDACRFEGHGVRNRFYRLTDAVLDARPAFGGGRSLAGLSGEPSQVPPSWNPFGDTGLDLEFDPAYPGGSIPGWLGSAPTPHSGAGLLTTIAGGGVAAEDMCGH
jgi:hypothetical protein